MVSFKINIIWNINNYYSIVCAWILIVKLIIFILCQKTLFNCVRVLNFCYKWLQHASIS